MRLCHEILSFSGEKPACCCHDALGGNNKLTLGRATRSDPQSRWLLGQMTPGSRNEVVLEQPWPLAFMLSRAACAPQRQSWGVTTETLWPTKPQISEILPFIQKVYQTLDANIFVNTTNIIVLKNVTLFQNRVDIIS